MFSALLIGGLPLFAIGTLMTWQTRQRRWIILGTGFLLLTLVPYLMVILACMIGHDCL